MRRVKSLAEIADAAKPKGTPAQAKPSPAAKPQRIVEHVDRPTEVLIVTDGHSLEVFGNKSVRLHIEQKPYMGADPSPEALSLAEEYVDFVLPRRLRQLYIPGGSYCRWQGLLERLTPRELAQRYHAMKLFREVEQLMGGQS